MNNEQYQAKCFRTNPSREQNKLSHQRLYDDFKMNLLHGSMGCCTEANELLDSIKKHIFYGRPLDLPNIKEEIGDILWYISMICNAMNWEISDMMDANITKLEKRYPNKFTEVDANNRDTKHEMSHY